MYQLPFYVADFASISQLCFELRMNTALTPSLAVLTVCEHLLLGRCSHVLTPVLVCVTVTSIPKLVYER